ncbi:MAG: hypothetical protein K2Q12_02680 [Rickettsiales bacterium]|nr:hypothetical protein [Rickettsiales bacterium]
MTNDTLPQQNASEREKAKTAQQRNEDMAYTINHAIACTVTDVIDPAIGDFTQKYLGKRIHVGCKNPAHQHGPDNPVHRRWHWWVGEVVGDFVAVPLTIAAQRYAPGVMHAVGKTMEIVLGPLYHWGAKRSARLWAKQNGFADDSPEYQARVREIYRHEVDHLPQAAVWTGSSIALNVLTQKLVGNHGPWWHIGLGKLAGASVSIGGVLGARAVMPETVRSLDQWTSGNLFLPATQAVGKIFGVDEQATQSMAQKDADLASSATWTKRISAENQRDRDAARDAQGL